MRAFAAVAIVVPLLTGCANDTTANLDARLSGLVGASQAELERRVGPPTRSFQTDGRMFLAYTERWPDISLYGLGRRGTLPTDIPPLYERFCEITFELAQGRVNGFAYRGSSCGWGGRPMIEPA